MAGSAEFRPVTEAEMAVLEWLWEHGDASIRDIAGALYPPGRPRQQATVQKLVQRLESKGHLLRDRSTQVHAIRPTARRDEFVGRQLRHLAERLSGGTVLPALLQMVAQSPLSKRDRDRLRRWLDQADRESRSKRT